MCVERSGSNHINIRISHYMCVYMCVCACVRVCVCVNIIKLHLHSVYEAQYGDPRLDVNIFDILTTQ